MNVKRALKAINEEHFVSVYERYGADNPSESKAPPIHMLKNHMDSELFEAIIDVFEKKDEIHYNIETTDLIEFFDENEVKEWLKTECTENPTYIMGMPAYMAIWIKQNTDYEQSIDDNGYYIINKKEAKSIEQKALTIWRNNL